MWKCTRLDHSGFPTGAGRIWSQSVLRANRTRRSIAEQGKQNGRLHSARRRDVIDGSGRERFRADVMIKGDRIAEIGTVVGPEVAGAHEIDVAGPGCRRPALSMCIPMTTVHCSRRRRRWRRSRGYHRRHRQLRDEPGAELSIDHAPPPPLDLIGDAADYRYGRFADCSTHSTAARRQSTPPAWSAIRQYGVGAMTALDRPANRSRSGVWANCCRKRSTPARCASGLAYAPAEHAPPAEIEALAAAAAGGSTLTTHMRNGLRVLNSLEESPVGRAAGVPVVISHHKTIGRQNFRRTAQTLRSSPQPSRGGDRARRLPLHRLLDGVDTTAPAERATKVLVTWSKSARGRRELSAIAADWGVDPKAAVDRLQPAGRSIG